MPEHSPKTAPSVSMRTAQKSVVDQVLRKCLVYTTKNEALLSEQPHILDWFSTLFIIFIQERWVGKALFRGTQVSKSALFQLNCAACTYCLPTIFTVCEKRSMLKYFPYFILTNGPSALILESNVNWGRGLIFMLSFLNTSLTYSPDLSLSKPNNSHFCTLSSDVNPTQPSNHLMTCFWWTSKPKRFPNWTSKMFEVSPSLYSTFQEHTPIDSGGSLESKLTIMQSGTSLATF